MRFVVASSVILLGTACGATCPAPVHPAATPPGTISIKDAPLGDAVAHAAKQSGQDISLDPGLGPMRTCARLTLETDASRAALAAALGRGLDVIGAALDDSGSLWVVRRKAGAPLPESCAGHATATDYTAWILAGVTKKSDMEFEVTAHARDLYLRSIGSTYPSLENPPGGGSGVLLRMSPRLYADRIPLYTGLGLRDGDVITSIAGIPAAFSTSTSDYEDAAAHSDGIVVQLVRDGKPMEIVYRVVDRGDAAATGFPKAGR